MALVVAVAVDVTNLIAFSDASKEVFKTATLLKSLNISSLITGEPGVGKKSLACYIFVDVPIFDASRHNELLVELESVEKIIITNLENSPNIKKILEIIISKNIKVIATAKSSFYHEYIDSIFSVKFDIPPLSQREEDIEPLIDRFAKEAAELFSLNEDFNDKNFKPDLSKNSDSLRRQVMISYLLQNIKESELIDIVQKYLTDRLGSNSDYEKFLHIYEAPLIRAGLERFKSQLQLSSKLGLNRNTLRKKIIENSKYL